MPATEIDCDVCMTVLALKLLCTGVLLLYTANLLPCDVETSKSSHQQSTWRMQRTHSPYCPSSLAESACSCSLVSEDCWGTGSTSRAAPWNTSKDIKPMSSNHAPARSHHGKLLAPTRVIVTAVAANLADRCERSPERALDQRNAAWWSHIFQLFTCSIIQGALTTCPDPAGLRHDARSCKRVLMRSADDLRLSDQYLDHLSEAVRMLMPADACCTAASASPISTWRLNDIIRLGY